MLFCFNPDYYMINSARVSRKAEDIYSSSYIIWWLVMNSVVACGCLIIQTIDVISQKVLTKVHPYKYIKKVKKRRSLKWIITIILKKKKNPFFSIKYSFIFFPKFKWYICVVSCQMYTTIPVRLIYRCVKIIKRSHGQYKGNSTEA